MAPVYVKGGIWTNVEDEILKASITKYGLNQWARVSSLVPKKTAKQCKARWHEWLDPTIRKIEWSREEDDKLLRMAKLLPNQWRSIAPAVGRTPTQCIERYQHLLDLANHEAGGDGADSLGLQGAGIESLAAAGATLQVGDLHLNPESKAARADQVEMDDEEKEMLSEARARLANTQGKKAKRKARERMLDASRRISLLQKRRELKNAGITTKLASGRKRDDKHLDYNAEDPVLAPPPPGLYSTEEEDRRNKREEARFKHDVSAAGLQSLEFQKQRAKEQKRTRDQAQTTVEAPEQLEEPQTDFKRRKLIMPAPVASPDAESTRQDGSAGPQQVSKDPQRPNLLDHIGPDHSGPEAPTSVPEDADDFDDFDDFEQTPQIDIASRLAALPKAAANYDWVQNVESVESVDETSGKQQEEANALQEATQESSTVDQGEVLRLKQLQKEQQERDALLKRPQALQRNLPVPQYDGDGSDIVDNVHTLVNGEFIRLVRAGVQTADLDDIHTASLDAVQELIAAELASKASKPLEHYRAAVHGSAPAPGLPGLDTHQKATSKQIQSLVQTLKGTAADSAKLEKKFLAFNAGYVKRYETLVSKHHELQKDLLEADLQLKTYREIEHMESIAITNRLHALQESVESLTNAESIGQKRYDQLIHRN